MITKVSDAVVKRNFDLSSLWGSTRYVYCDAQLKETNNILAGLNISHVRTRDCFILHTEEGECKSV